MNTNCDTGGWRYKNSKCWEYTLGAMCAPPVFGVQHSSEKEGPLFTRNNAAPIRPLAGGRRWPLVTQKASARFLFDRIAAVPQFPRARLCQWYVQPTNGAVLPCAS